MKRFSVIFQCIISVALIFNSSTTYALPPVSSVPPKLQPSPLLITGYYFSNGNLQFLQIFNNTDKAVSLDKWTIRLSDDGVNVSELVLPASYVVPREYIIVSNNNAVSSADLQVTITAKLSSDTPNDSVQLISPTPGTATEGVQLKMEKDSKGNITNNHYDSRQALTQSSAGNYTSTSTFKQELFSAPLYGHGTYEPRAEFPLLPEEILANPRSCAPNDVAGECKEYVKLHNTTNAPVRLDGIRVRAGYQGQVASAGNAVDLSGALESGEYLTVPISITNTGGYVWIEDSYGAVMYTNTVVEYPDASSVTHKGQSWALSPDGMWQWMWPNATGPSAQLTDEQVAEVGGKLCSPDQYLNPTTNRCKKNDAETIQTPCNDDQERSTETGRCRKMATVTAIATCAVDQERNPDTGRCRKTTTVSASLVPCKPGQERSVDTNRCRTIAATTDDLKPCAPGYERNLDTNRCRKAADNTAAGYKADKNSSSQRADYTLWWALGGLGVVALGYIIWEWRAEIVRAIQQVNPFSQTRRG